MLSTLSVREYEPIKIGQHFSKHEKTITRSQAKLLEKFEKKQGKTIFTWGNNKVTPQQWVGVFGIADLQIEVLPKLALGGEEDFIRKNLIYMLSVAKEVPLRVQDLGRMNTAKAPLLECFIMVFIDKLNNAIKKGIIHDYSSIEENSYFLKGKLNVSMQLRKNLLNRNKFYVSYDEFTTNNIPNRILKATIVKLMNISSSSQNVKRLHIINTSFANINEREFSITDFNRLVLTPTFKQNYNEVFEMSKMFWREEIPNLQDGSSDMFGILFDMNVVYEKFVQNLLINNQDSFASNNIIQTNQMDNSKFLLKTQVRGAFKLKPDIFIFNTSLNQTVSIIDTKWKILKANKPNLGINQKDIYQMYVYAREFDVEMITLLYPHSEGLPKIMPVYFNDTFSDKKLEIRIKTLNLNFKFPEEIDKVLAQLIQVVEI